MIVLDYMIADMVSNKKLNPIVTELFFRGSKLNISVVSITQSYFAVPKTTWLNSTQYFISQKLQLNIHQILAMKTLWIFTRNILQNRILF